MNLKQLVDQFDLVTDTEEGLEQLRKLILNLGVRGKLTKQNSNDESVKVLLERIEDIKDELYDKRKIRKPRSLEPLKDEEIPFGIPPSWKWCKIGDIGKIQGGGTPKTSNDQYWTDKGISWLTPADLNGNGKYISRGRRDISKKGLENSSTFLLPKGTVLFSSRAPIGYVAIADKDLATNQGFQSCIPYLLDMNSYIYYYLKYVGELLDERASGTTFKEVSGTFVANVEFPLPPLEEQQRIVQEIETLFTQVDELEQKVHQDREVDELLQVAVLDDLQSAETPEVSKQSWQRLTDHFEQIYRKPEHIDQLKQAILNEAVRGRLAPQDPNDEPADQLLEHIKEEKQRLYDEGEIRKSKDLPEISDEEIPYELPMGWTWERFGNLGVINPRNDVNDDIEASFVPMKMISENFSYEHEFKVKKWKEIKSGYTHFAEGDIGLAKITPCFENGKAAIFKGLKNGIGAGTTELYIFRTINNTILNRYAYLYLQTPKFREEGKNNMTGTAGQQRVPKSYFEEALFPLPPFNEQKRIIEKIYHLFAWCDDLKEKLNRSQQNDQRLLEALVNGH